ncbi:MAG: hypothetical protein ACK4N6_05705, partial [Rhodocyclaceae bacterium]
MSRILKLRGAAAFSPSHLARLQNELATRLAAEHWYFVEVDAGWSAAHEERLKALLGIPPRLPPEPEGTMLLVTPRLGTISPWSSKATDIAHNCGFDAVKRIERGIAYILPNS